MPRCISKNILTFSAAALYGAGSIGLVVVGVSVAVIAVSSAPSRADTRSAIQAAHAAAVGATPSSATIDPLMRIDDAKSGTLLFETDDADRYVAAQRLATDFQVTVSGPTARTTVTQHFANPTNGYVEAVYVLPLPNEAAVDGLKMIIGDRVVVADIKERGDAKRIYDAAKLAGRKATLLVQQRPNIFTQRVANIGPRETIVVQFTYQQRVAMSDGAFHLRLPLVVPPLFNPLPVVQTVDFADDGGLGIAKISDPVPDRPDRHAITAPVLDPRVTPPRNPVSITIALDAGFALGRVASAHHDIDIALVNTDAARRVIKLKAGAVPANRDFEIEWRGTLDGAAPSVGLFQETIDGETYVLGFVVPPVLSATDAKAPPLTPQPRDVVYVIDTSGSMGGQSIRQAKAALQLGLDQLTPADTFNIIRFASSYEALAGSSIAATQDNIQRARQFVDVLHASGGTMMVPPLRAALARAAVDPDRVRQVVFLTDGAIGNTAEMFQVLGDDRGASRVFMVGIGSAPNTHLMQRASEIGRGTFTHIGSTEQIEARMRALLTKLTQPVVTDLRVEVMNGDGAMQVTPQSIPDVYANAPVEIAGRTRSLQGDLRVTGRIGRRPWTITLPLAKAAAGVGISKVWARRKIAELESARYLGDVDGKTLDAALLKVALDHSLVTRLTSLVAVDAEISRPKDAPLTAEMIPLNLPDGWDFDKVFGPRGDGVDRGVVSANDHRAEARPNRPVAPSTSDMRLQGSDARLQGSANKRIAARATPQQVSAGPWLETQTLMVPKGATDAELRVMLGLVLLLLAAVVAVGWQRGLFAEAN